MSVPSFSGSKKATSPNEKPASDLSLNLDEATSQTLPAEQLKTAKPTMKKKEKKIKDPAAPKRPLSAFFVFTKEQRPLLLAELGNLTVGELAKEFGRRWAAMDQQQRQPYEENIKDDWIRYREEIKVYQPSAEFLEKKAECSAASNVSMESNNDGTVSYFNHLMNSWRALSFARTDLSGKEIQDLVWSSWTSNKSDSMSTCKVKKVKDPAEPKKPKSGFQLFVDSRRHDIKNANPGIDSKGIIKTSTENWENVHEDVRRRYLEKADKLQAKYQELIVEYKKSLEIKDNC